MYRNRKDYGRKDWHTAHRIGLEAMKKIADAGIDDFTGADAMQEAARGKTAKNEMMRTDAIVSELINSHALDGLGVPFTVESLGLAARQTRLGQDRWIKKNLGDKKKAAEALRSLFDRNHWRPQDIANAMNLKGHTVRRYTRGETAFDAAFLLRALHVMASSPAAGLLPPNPQKG